MALSSFFTEGVLPFLLVFVVTFAILQKSKILGEGKNQLDALTALVIALLLIGLPGPRDFIVNFMPWVAVGVAVILVFLILYGFVAGDLSGNNVKPWMKITFGILAGLFTIGVVLYVGGFWDTVLGWFNNFGGNDSFWLNALVIILVIALMVIAVLGSKEDGSSGSGTPDKH